MKSRQGSLGEKAPVFDQDVLTVRRGRTLIEVVGDALLRRFGSWQAAADALNKAYSPEGRGVTDALLRASFSPSGEVSRNHARIEWIAIVADDREVRDYFVGLVMTPEQELASLREHFARNAPGELERFDRTVRR